MVVIRLSRAGAVHRPFYHVVVADSRSRRDSKHIETLGYLNYYAGGAERPLELDVERLEHWVSKGAIVRPSVAKLVRRMKRGDTEPKKKKKAAVPGPAPKTEAVAEEKPQPAGEPAPATEPVAVSPEPAAAEFAEPPAGESMPAEAVEETAPSVESKTAEQAPETGAGETAASEAAEEATQAGGQSSGTNA